MSGTCMLLGEEEGDVYTGRGRIGRRGEGKGKGKGRWKGETEKGDGRGKANG